MARAAAIRWITRAPRGNSKLPFAPGVQAYLASFQKALRRSQILQQPRMSLGGKINKFSRRRVLVSRRRRHRVEVALHFFGTILSLAARGGLTRAAAECAQRPSSADGTDEDRREARSGLLRLADCIRTTECGWPPDNRLHMAARRPGAGEGGGRMSLKLSSRMENFHTLTHIRSPR